MMQVAIQQEPFDRVRRLLHAIHGTFETIKDARASYSSEPTQLRAAQLQHTLEALQQATSYSNCANPIRLEAALISANNFATAALGDKLFNQNTVISTLDNSSSLGEQGQQGIRHRGPSPVPTPTPFVEPRDLRAFVQKFQQPLDACRHDCETAAAAVAGTALIGAKHQGDGLAVHVWAQLAELQQQDAGAYEALQMFGLLRDAKPVPLPLLQLLWQALHPGSEEADTLSQHLKVLSSQSLATKLCYQEDGSSDSAEQLVYYTVESSVCANTSPAMCAAVLAALSQRVCWRALQELMRELMLLGAAAAVLVLACRHGLPSTLAAAVAGAGSVVGLWCLGRCAATFMDAQAHDAACKSQLAVLLLGYGGPQDIVAAAQRRLGLRADGAGVGMTPRLTECAWTPWHSFDSRADLYRHMGEVMCSSGDLLAAEMCFRKDIALKRRQLPAGHLQIVKSLHTLAAVLYDQGQTRAAIRVLQEGAPLHARITRLDNPDLAASLLEYALQPLDQAQLATLLAANAEVLAMQRMLLPSRHDATAGTLHIRAALLRANGNYQQALAASEEAVAMLRSVLQPSSNTLALANALHNLAWQRKACGDFPGALQACQEALALRRQLLPHWATDVGLSLMQQAWIFSELGQHKAAQSAHVEAWDILCTPAAAAGRTAALVSPAAQGETVPATCQHPAAHTTAGSKEQHEAALLFQQAWLLRDQGQPESAAAACQQALAFQQQVYPLQHPAIAASLSLQAAIQADQGQLEIAAALCEDALEMRQQLYPQQHPDVAMSLFQKAWLLDRRDQHEVAADVCQQALVLRSKIYPKLHRDIALSLQQQAALLKSQGKLKLAGAVCKQALAMQQQLFADLTAHRDIAATLQLQAWLLNDQGYVDEAVSVCNRALAMRQQLFPQHHQEIAQSLEQLAWLMVNEGRLEAATASCTEALEMRRKLLPPAHTDIANSLCQRAWLLIAKDKIEAAEDVCQEALAMRQQLLPAQHKDVLASLQQQMWLESRSGQKIPTAFLSCRCEQHAAAAAAGAHVKKAHIEEILQQSNELLGHAESS